MPVRRDMPESCISTYFSESSCCSRRRSFAASIVVSMIGEHRNRSLMSSGLRPIAAALRRTSRRYSFIFWMLLPSVMMVSAHFDANFLPAAEPPACTIGTLPWGERGALIGPRTLKYLPSWLIGRTFLPSANIGMVGSSTTASSSQASHKRVTTSANSSATS